MHDPLIHGYFGIDLEIVWETIIGDLPKFIVKVKKIHSMKEKE